MPELIEYIGPLCRHVCPSCGGCDQCCDGQCHIRRELGYEPQEDPNG